MSSTGQGVGYVVGAIAGYFTGGTSYILMGAAIGGAIGSAIDPPKGPALYGPRLSDLSQQTSSYGQPIPRLYGTAAVFGNIFWLENNKLKEVAKTDSVGGKGGGGSEQTTYIYKATFALGLCKGPIAGVRRIWISGKLIYDAASDDIDTILASNASASGWTLHYGTETQGADARMQATLGAANTPAYRGLAYLVFEDFVLTDYGNTLVGAQIKVEVVQEGSFGTWTRPWNRSYTSLLSGAYSHKLGIPTPESRSFDGVLGFCRMKSEGGYTNALLITLDLMREGEVRAAAPPPLNTYFNIPTWSECDYRFIAADYGFQTVWFSAGSGLGTTLNVGLDYTVAGAEPAWSFFSKELGVSALTVRSGVSNTCWIMMYHGTVPIVAKSVESELTPRLVFDYDTDKLYLIYKVFGSTVMRVERYDYPDLTLDFTLDAVAPSTLLDIGDGLSITDGELWSSYLDGGFHYLSRFDMETFSRTYFSILPSATIASTTHCWVEKNAIVRLAGAANASADILVTGRLTPADVPLADIVSAECLNAGLLTAADIDVTDLSDNVHGYRINSVAAIRSGLEPLQGVWPFDVVQSGYTIKFVRRGAAGSVATIAEADLGAASDRKATEPALIMTREMDSQLPARVTATYFDSAREYDTGEQTAERLNTGAINERRLELAVVLTTSEAAKLVESLMYLYWLERYDFPAIKLPPTYRHLEPADVIDVVADEATHRLRLTQVHYLPDGSLEVAAKPHRPSVYTSFAVGEAGNQSTGTIKLPGLTVFELLDIPTLLDTLDGSGFLVAMAGYSIAWQGGTLYRSTDGGQAWSDINSFTTPSVIGYAVGTLAAPADSRMIDKANRLQVKLYGEASISSVTEAQLLNGANHFAFGIDGRWEIIAAQNAVLQGDGSYILSDLLRGRFGTEWAMGSHQVYDHIVLLDAQRLQICAIGLNAIDAVYQYRGLSTRSLNAGVGAQQFTYRGVNLECLSPVYLNGSRHPSTNDWYLTWIRRTRIGGEWRDKVDAPLGEASEAYEVEIYSSAAYTALKRTLTGLSSAAATYTSAQQVADFGSNQATLYVKVYQLSANVGRGQPLTTSITR